MAATGSGHLVPKNSRTHFFNHLVPVRDGGTRWHLAVENSTGWYEVAGIIFRLVRVGWQKFPAGTRWPAEISILEGAKGERRAGCPDEVRLEERLAGD
jgi:polyribonucleotide 5'-hydroxyl-kinase